MHILANLPLLNRENALPQDNWYMVARKGDHPITITDPKTGKPVTVIQVVDDVAIASMVNRFQEQKKANPSTKLLVDRDHFSDDMDLPSEAFGWISDLANREDGLWAEIKWTDLGEPAVKNLRYRFLSPVWNVNDCEVLSNATRLRPLRLDKAGLTNQPNIRGMVPLANRETSPAGAGRKESTMDSKKELLTLLGLDATATDEQITAAIKTHKEKMQNSATEQATLKNRVAELEKKELEAQVEKDLEQYKDRITAKNRDSIKAQLLKNRTDALAIIVAMEPVATQRFLNRADAKTPAGGATEETQIAQRRAAQDELIEKNMKNRRCSTRAEAFEFARKENPALFA